MALQVWLPLTTDLRNQGLTNTTITNSGATFISSGGKLGGCYSFDGTDDRLSYTPSVDSLEEFSVALWLCPAAATPSGAFFSIERDTYWQVTLWNDKIGIRDNSIGYNGTRKDFSTGTYTANVWTHIAITYNKGTLKIYRDGILLSTNAVGGAKLNTGINQGRIGSAAQAGYFHSGKISDVRFYDNCLSDEEVKELSRGLVLHYHLDNNGFGNENLLLNTSNLIDTSHWIVNQNTTLSVENKYLKVSFVQNNSTPGLYQLINLTSGTYTFSTVIKVTNSPRASQAIRLYLANSSGSAIGVDKWPDKSRALDNGYLYHEWTFTLTSDYTNLRFYILEVGSLANETWLFRNLKLEKSSKATPWSPAPSDNILGINDNIIYDCSGYENNGIINNITISTDTPKYIASSVFNGTNSYIKVNENNWMSQGTRALTVNLWAKTTTWPSNGGRLFSCTETGGFNSEAGNSGYWRFPMYVYTAEGASPAYKYDSNEIKISDLIANAWNMITWVYDASQGTKTYINGQLHHTYNNVSYGVCYNTSARLFLGCEANTASPYTPYFNGSMSDFRLYMTALSADDVLALYNNKI